MDKLYSQLLKLLKNKILLKIIYYFLFFWGSLFILSGLGNFFSDSDEIIGLVFLIVGIIIITLLLKYEKIF
jgi:hypothetical protein